METFEKIQKIKQLHQLIKLRATGNAKEFSKRAGMSVSTLKRELNSMRLLGCPVKFCRYSGSYYYEYEGNIELKFKKKC